MFGGGGEVLIRFHCFNIRSAAAATIDTVTNASSRAPTRRQAPCGQLATKSSSFLRRRLLLCGRSPPSSTSPAFSSDSVVRSGFRVGGRLPSARAMSATPRGPAPTACGGRHAARRSARRALLADWEKRSSRQYWSPTDCTLRPRTLSLSRRSYLCVPLPPITPLVHLKSGRSSATHHIHVRAHHVPSRAMKLARVH